MGDHLWRRLRTRQVQGWKFRRLDFYCLGARLAIQLDGGGHNFANRESLNQKRTRFLASENILVLRFWNYQINRELE
jgi:very-short-patch-repair endonuclease